MKLKRHLFISVIVLLVLGANIYTTVSTSERLDQLKEDNLQEIKDDELVFIKSIIDENIDKAKLQANTVKDSAEQTILNTYSDSDKLAMDLSSVGDKKVYHILQDSISGKYLNVKNDNNDMFVWIPNLGKVADTSKNCAFEKGQSVTIEGEMAKQNNKELAKIALNSIINQENKRYIFWNYLVTPDGFYLPQTMDMSEIDKLYSLYGLEGLKYLEFLAPAYLRQDTDILGVSDVNYNGVKNDNNKIIFIQGFNAYDDIEANHMDVIQHYTDLLTYTSAKYDAENNAVMGLGILVSIILLMGFISLVREINKT